MAPLLGCQEREEMAALGVAFQLTNFIRDVREDWTLDRVYLPGLPRTTSHAVRRGTGHVSGSPPRSSGARALFAATEDVPGRLRSRDRSRGWRMARSVYRGVLERWRGSLSTCCGARRPPPRGRQVARAAAGGCARDQRRHGPGSGAHHARPASQADVPRLRRVVRRSWPFARDARRQRRRRC
jgi:phytoene synthase